MVRIANPYTVCPQNDSTSSAMRNRLQVCQGVARGHTGKREQLGSTDRSRKREREGEPY